MEIEVTYQCWGCGSEKTQIEDAEEPLPGLVRWNICPNCILRRLGFVLDPVDGIGLIPND
jgi:DNA-directed RNA polymerase subunit RPC12/RpoP